MDGNMAATPGRASRILHIFRAPVGGLFRHVDDLVRAQAAAGLEAGVICDSSTGGSTGARALSALEPYCALGIHRMAMPRLPGPRDITALGAVRRRAARFEANILHGHGAKGGLYARLGKRACDARAFYTPHGGTLHYDSFPQAQLYREIEKFLMRFTDGLVFESAFARRAWIEKIGPIQCAQTIVHNGIGEADGADLPVAPARRAYDFCFVGELRTLKGVDVLLEALAALAPEHRASALIAGDGADADALKALARQRGVSDQVDFPGSMPAREAFAQARVAVVPSRKESFPYIVLEAAACGQPMIATGVGGIPEIFGPHADALIAPGDVTALKAALATALTRPRRLAALTNKLRARVSSEFTVARMAHGITQFYHAAGTPGAETGPATAKARTHSSAKSRQGASHG